MTVQTFGTLEFGFPFGGSVSNVVIDWASKRQPTIATSTAHAETTAFFEAVKRVVYIRRLVKGFDMPQLVLHKPTIINCDNAACVVMNGV